MKLAEFFLIEGAEDARFRDLADRCTRAIISHVKARNADYVGQTDDGMAAGWLMNAFRADGEVRKEFKKLIFFIEVIPGRQNWASYNKTEDDRDLITLYRGLDKKFNAEEDFSVFISVEGPNLVSSAYTHLFHEVIHMLDAHRHDDPDYAKTTQHKYDPAKVRKGDEKEMRKYYNTPMEINAYIQQDLNTVWNELSKAKSMDDVMAMTGTSSQREFVDAFLSKMHKKFRDRIKADTRKRVIKRVMQFWNDLEKKFSG